VDFVDVDMDCGLQSAALNADKLQCQWQWQQDEKGHSDSATIEALCRPLTLTFQCNDDDADEKPKTAQKKQSKKYRQDYGNG